MKKCSKCKKQKSEIEFSKCGKTLQRYCKACNRQAQQSWRQTKTGKSSTKTTKKKMQEQSRRFIARLLNKSSCALCGFSNPLVLQFDHVNPSDKSHEIGKLIKLKSTSIASLKLELRKCRILCANCHFLVTAQQQNSWRYQIFDNTTKKLSCYIKNYKV